VESPLSVLHDLKTASLTPESVETIQAVYPKLYDDMKLAVMDQLSSHLTKKDASLPYRHKMALSLFLGQDLDQSLTPESIHTNQTVIAATGMQQNQGQPGNPNPQAKSITIASRTLLPSQQASERGQA
jgi:dsDNA-binding SOS-regulon protein